MLIIIALGLGVCIGWIDSRPSWNDTGITAIIVFGVTALLGLTFPKRAWIWAILISIWIPIWNILLRSNYESLIAVAIALVGAYGGAFFNKTFFS
jgi:hypothetical protein